MNREPRREATGREKALQVLLGFVVFLLITAIALVVLILVIKIEHLG